MSRSPTTAESAKENQDYFQAWEALGTLAATGKSFSGRERNCVFWNIGTPSAQCFADVSGPSGLDFPDDGRALAVVDWDHDGDLDLWFSNRTSPRVRFMRNNLPAKNHYVAVRLEGRTSNRDAIGARVELVMKQPKSIPTTDTLLSTLDTPPSTLIKTVSAGTGFLSQSSKWLHFGLAGNQQGVTLIVRWPGQAAETFTGIEVDRRYKIVQGSGKATVWEPPRARPTLEPSTTPRVPTTEEARIVLIDPAEVGEASFTALDGESVSLDAAWYRRATRDNEQGLLVNLWATWCSPCLAELREFGERAEELRAAGLDVLALSVDAIDVGRGAAESHNSAQDTITASEQFDEHHVVAFLERLDFPFTAGIANLELVNQLSQLQSAIVGNKRSMPVPTSFLVNGRGQVSVIYKGPVRVEQVLADVHLLNADTEVRAEAATPFPGRWTARLISTTPLSSVGTYLEGGYIDEAIDYLLESRNSTPEDATTLAAVAKLSWDQGKRDEALRRFREALAIDPNRVDIHQQFALTLYRGGDPDAAVKHLRQILREQPDSIGATNSLAWILAASPTDHIRNGPEAVKFAEQASGAKEHREPQLLDTLGVAYAEVGRFQDAIRVTLKAIGIVHGEDEGLLEELNGRLARYQQNLPFRDAPAAPVESGHSLMLALLRQMAAETPRVHAILGDKAARVLRRQLAELKSISATRSPSEKALRLHAKLGEEELRLNNLEQGIEHLATVHRLRKQLRDTGSVSREAAAIAAYRLGIAYMRMGETQNCCRRNTVESCLLPIRGSGIHTWQEGSWQAITCFTEVLQATPETSALYLKARWLLNIMYMTVDGYPHDVPPHYLIPPDVFHSDEPFPKFANVAPQLGLDTFDLLGGAIVDDFTGDGYLDIVTSTWDPKDEMHFFRNNRDGTFSDQTKQANLVGLVGGFNLVQADYDNDGDLDILMLRGAWMGKAGRIPNSLLRNNGDGMFTDVTFESGLGEVHYPTQTAAWADYDNDGDVDLYIGNEQLDRAANSPCQLFRNNGDGTFTDVAREAGVLNFGLTKGVAWGDYDEDGFPDLYVSNLGTANRLFHNNGDATFTDVAQQVAVTGPLNSFPVWFWDFNNDGILDLYVSSYEWERGNLAAVAASRLGMPDKYELAHLYQGDGRGGFEEVATDQKLTQLTLPMGANFGDLDNDGYLDFYLGTGYPDYDALMPNVMYRNQGGTGFSDVTSAGGFGHLQKGHAVVFADLDNDGDQDVFEQIGGFQPGDKFFNALFENPGFGNHWITVQLVGVRSNRSAIGARIRVDVMENGRQRSIYKHVNSGGSFGANPLRQMIGLGKASAIEVLEIFWPTTGLKQTFDDVPLNVSIQITEGENEYTLLTLNQLELGSTPAGE